MSTDESYERGAAMIREAQESIRSTQSMINESQKKMESVQDCSKDIEERWEAFQNDFKAVLDKMADAIGASLNASADDIEHKVIAMKDLVMYLQNASNVVVLTGAGISVASGIPTYRGDDGTWTVGSENYTSPEEIATFEMFQSNPEMTWNHYRHWHERLKTAQPNEGHLSLVRLQQYIEARGKRFCLITQNIDNLHVLAGHPSVSLYQIHGNLNFARCSGGCKVDLLPFPKQKENVDKCGVPLCSSCGKGLRPHVLFFDETYDEVLFQSTSALHRVQEADLLITIGTTFQTGLPRRILHTAGLKGVPVVDINPVPNDDISLASLHQLKVDAEKFLPKLMACLEATDGARGEDKKNRA